MEHVKYIVSFTINTGIPPCELIIFILMNFILEKSFTYCTNVHSYFENGNKCISTYKSQCFKEVYDFMLDHTHCSAGPRVRQFSFR